MDIVKRLQMRPDQAQGSRLLDCLDAAAEILRLRAELAAAEARGIAAERERIAAWLEGEREQYRTVFRDQALPMGVRQDACIKTLVYTKIVANIRCRSLPHDPIKGDEGRE